MQQHEGIIHFPGRDPTYLAVNHVGDHHNLVRLGIRKFEGQFGCLNVKCQNHRVLEGQPQGDRLLVSHKSSHGRIPLCIPTISLLYFWLLEATIKRLQKS